MSDCTKESCYTTGSARGRVHHTFVVPDSIPAALKSEGWSLQEPPLPELESFPMCDAPHRVPRQMPACNWDCMVPASAREKMQYRMQKNGVSPMLQSMVGELSKKVNRSTVCERCECQLCAICSKPANRWTSPSGQEIETVTTRTQPRFTFAYNPFDDDMTRMREHLILEPTLTHAWHEATAKCCRETKGLVVDVGGNFGWYTLYSLALGCSVAVFEPVPAYREVMRLGLALNPGFAERTTLYGNVVYDTPGNYTLRVPRAMKRGRMKKLGMTGMAGAAGILKADWTANSYNHVASSARIDDIIGVGPQAQHVCMLKADVEGYEPQVLQTARRLLTRKRARALAPTLFFALSSAALTTRAFLFLLRAQASACPPSSSS